MPFSAPGSSSSGGGSVVFFDEGNAVGTAAIINFTGAGGTATLSGGTVVYNVSGGTVATPTSGGTILGAGNYTGTGASFGTVTGGTIIITTGAHKVRLTATGAAQVGTNADGVGFDFAVDGTAVSGATNGLTGMRVANSGHRQNFSFSYLTPVLSAGSHTFALMTKRTTGSGTITIFADTTDMVTVFSAQETDLS